MRVIISGGGTGGHIFPALSIADMLKKRHPNAEILFVGAENRMEMQRVPVAGYPIVGLPVAGFDRANLLKNVSVVMKLVKSLLLARKTIKGFRPDVVVGVGGYASGPTLRMAAMLGVPTLIQEQNSYAGVTNKLLAKTATAVCVAYPNMERFFPKEKIVLTGNPVRPNLLQPVDRNEAYRHFDLDPQKKTVLVVGGSLGARTVNRSIMGQANLLKNSDVQVLWQCGGVYVEQLKEELMQSPIGQIRLHDFITRMDYAYAVADLVVSRAGASSISELCLLGKPVILVPSPNVAEDHQTKNALALSEKGAAVLIRDADAPQKLVPEALALVADAAKLNDMASKIHQLALPESAEKIADQIEKIVCKSN